MNTKMISNEPPAHLCTPRTQSSAQQCWVLDNWQAQTQFPSCVMGHASVNRRQTKNQRTLSEHWWGQVCRRNGHMWLTGSVVWSEDYLSQYWTQPDVFTTADLIKSLTAPELRPPSSLAGEGKVMFVSCFVEITWDECHFIWTSLNSLQTGVPEIGRQKPCWKLIFPGYEQFVLWSHWLMLHSSDHNWGFFHKTVNSC